MFFWLVNTHPEPFCFFNRGSQVVKRKLSKDKIADFNKAVKITKIGAQSGLKHKRLDASALRLKICADGTFAWIDFLSSQLGFLTLLPNQSEKKTVLDYSGKFSKSVARPVIGGEIFDFAIGFCKALLLRQDLNKTLGINVPLHSFTDLEQFFDSVPKG